MARHRTIAASRTWRKRSFKRWSWTPVIDGGWRTGCGGYTLTRRGAFRAGRRWHDRDVEMIRRIYVPTDYAEWRPTADGAPEGVSDGH